VQQGGISVTAVTVEVASCSNSRQAEAFLLSRIQLRRLMRSGRCLFYLKQNKYRKNLRFGTISFLFPGRVRCVSCGECGRVRGVELNGSAP
jgi:hypothetical protein